MFKDDIHKMLNKNNITDNPISLESNNKVQSNETLNLKENKDDYISNLKEGNNNYLNILSINLNYFIKCEECNKYVVNVIYLTNS
jgi:hypothetical protein